MSPAHAQRVAGWTGLSREVGSGLASYGCVVQPPTRWRRRSSLGSTRGARPHTLAEGYNMANPQDGTSERLLGWVGTGFLGAYLLVLPVILLWLLVAVFPPATATTAQTAPT